MQMLTIKKRGRRALAIVAAVSLTLTACTPPGPRALKKGDTLLQTGQYAEAIDQLSQAVDLLANETNTAIPAKANELLGLAYQYSGKADKARQAYLNALKLNRNLAEADYNLGCLELQQTNLLQASQYFITYTTLRPADVNGLVQLGVAYYRSGLQSFTVRDRVRLFDNAKQTFLKAQNLIRTPEAANFIGLILIQSDLQTRPAPTPAAVAEAIKQFKDATTRDPHYAPALLNLAIVYDQYAHDGKTAYATYGQYLHLSPLPPHARDVALVMTNLDLQQRLDLRPTSTNHVGPPATALPNPTPGISVAPSKPTPPPTKPASTETNPPQTPVTPAVVVSQVNPTPAPLVVPSALPAASKPQEAPPAAVAMNTPAANSSTAPPSREPTPGMGVNPATTDPAAETATPSRKPSMLNPFNWFGGRAKPPPDASGNSASPSADSTLTVTPLPPPQPVTRYSPPPVMMYAGNRLEADRQMQVGAIAEKDSRLKEAMASYQEAIKADPSYFEACESLGLVAIKSEEYAVALEALHHALTLKSDSAEARYGYAWALEKKHYYLDAAKELETMLIQHPDEIRARLLLAEIYAQRLGQINSARAHYLKVLQADPQNPQATAIRFWLQANPEH